MHAPPLCRRSAVTLTSRSIRLRIIVLITNATTVPFRPQVSSQSGITSKKNSRRSRSPTDPQLVCLQPMQRFRTSQWNQEYILQRFPFSQNACHAYSSLSFRKFSTSRHNRQLQPLQNSTTGTPRRWLVCCVSGSSSRWKFWQDTAMNRIYTRLASGFSIYISASFWPRSFR